LEKSPDYIDELIGKQLAGEAGEEEIAFIDSWVQENDDNRRYADQLRVIFQQAAAARNFQEYDTDAAWNKLRQSLKKHEAKSVDIHGGTSRQLMWRVAASIVVFIGAGIFAYRMFIMPDPASNVIVEATKVVVSDTLPDGSDVVLNKETTLAYSFDKKTKIHRVRLKGEAYFNIQHDKTKTFIVDISGVLIKDIGTSFNVKAYPESNTIEVVVETGEVMFYTDQDSGVYLRANGKGIYDRDTRTFRIDQPESNVLSYKTKFFSFSNTDLAKVAEALNNVYDKKLVLADNLKNCHLTVSFNDEDQDEIVTVIAETLGLTVKESGGNFVLEGPGCE